MSANQSQESTAGNTESKNSDQLDIYWQSNLTKGQLWFWIGQNLEPERPLFNMPMAIAIHGKVDHDRFNRAFKEVIKRADALRTTIGTTDEGVPRRTVQKDIPYEVELKDFSQADDPRAAFEEWGYARCQEIFDMSSRMFDAVLCKLAEDDYVWYWCQHHLICDGWSTALVYRRTAEIYEAMSKGEDIDAISDYPDYDSYVEKEHKYRRSKSHERSKKYWDKVLEEPLDTLGFYGHTAHESGSTEFLRVTCDVGQARTDGLRALAKSEAFKSLSENLSVFQLISTCILAYLYRITGNERLGLGTLYHNRTTPVYKDTAGLFMEMAPLRVQLAEDDTFETLFKKIRNAATEIMRHYRFAPGNPIHNRTYDVALNYNNASYPPFAGSPMNIKWLHSATWYSHEPLAIQIHDFAQTGSLTAAFDFNCGVFDEHDRQQVVDHFMACIDALIADPSQTVAHFDILTEAEKRDVLGTFTRGESVPVPDVCIHQLIEEQAEKSPDAIAVISEGKELTYAELNSRANRLAAHLQSRGARPDQLIGLCIKRSHDLMVALLAILKAGCGYLPLDPDYPPERLTFMIQDATVDVLITQEALIDELPEHKAKLVVIDRDWETIAGGDAPAGNVKSDAKPNNLAYVIYTSGSTGRPKGVLIEHRSLVNYTLAATEKFEITDKDRVLQFAPISFDAAAEEIYPTLTSGGTLYLLDDDMLASMDDFIERCEKDKLNVLDLPAAFWHQLIDSMGDKLELPESVRLTIIGAERALPSHVVRWLEELGSRTRLVNSYGPTECTIVATFTDLTLDKMAQSAETPIGRPVRNVEAHILDKRMQPVPLGVPGELYIGGAALARGYLGRDELTAQKFVRNPFSDDPNARLYRTGDLVRFRRDGEIEYLDRVDNQVKVRGFRIELGEVEAAVNKCEGIKHSVVVVQESRPGDKRLVAYYVIEPGASLTGTEIRSQLRAALPDYMVPQHFVALEEFPMTPSGKINRKDLPNPLAGAGHDDVEYIEPETEAEKQIATVWSEVLDVEKIGRHDNFFNIGGHSLLMMQVIAKMNKKLGFAVSPRNIVMLELSQLAAEWDAKGGPKPTAAPTPAPASSENRRAEKPKPKSARSLLGRVKRKIKRVLND